MHVFINERDLGSLTPGGATVGEIIDAMTVHVDPREILTSVTIDGTTFSAGEGERYARRAGAGVDRLTLTTQPPAAFAAAKRTELTADLHAIAARLRSVVELFGRGDHQDANALLAALLEELRLAMLLDHHLTALDGAATAAPTAALAEVAPALLEAEQRGDWRTLASVIEMRLVPLLES
jgi:hypothetical protein